MRLNLALALSVAVLLIGGASWYRFSSSSTVDYNLAVVEPALTNEDYDEIIADFLGPKATSTAVVETNLTNTDLIGRQLVLDYISIAANNGGTEADIAALANQYVEGIQTLNRVDTISYADIKTVSNTKSNFQNYSDAATQIYNEYEGILGGAARNSEALNGLSPGLYSVTATMSEAYTGLATKLKNLAVPASVAQSHVELVNIYLSNAVAMEAISETENDPASAFAGLITLKENSDREQELLDQINQILTSNGI
ncbi:MAG: hypothetical protein A3G05_00515 [Candidatus Zambryskibacteria bacterium RIFCSPLOWO2_12_FULL_45_14]|uniref:Uncharacterized protein n=1 Tax=Candidatus Zambryskibacteria bacterium RIFCSPLOWO2_12_FULL_45_14 TaxID=1802778 RepID=A0A1G2UW89_9BACT|nr:MAG: hypothetical protein A3G05_00515 [Candidatus Zambryskibacteria bacterium RIFCSPLOWO2_12_FULL_45_14]